MQIANVGAFLHEHKLRSFGRHLATFSICYKCPALTSYSLNYPGTLGMEKSTNTLTLADKYFVQDAAFDPKPSSEAFGRVFCQQE